MATQLDRLALAVFQQNVYRDDDAAHSVRAACDYEGNSTLEIDLANRATQQGVGITLNVNGTWSFVDIGG